MKSMIEMAIGSVSALASGVAYAQNGNMMSGGGMWGGGWMGGYGGYWVPILLVAVVGAVVWAVLQTRKSPKRAAARIGVPIDQRPTKPSPCSRP